MFWSHGVTELYAVPIGNQPVTWSTVSAAASVMYSAPECEVAQDVSLRANGHFARVTDADGQERELVTNPVQFDEQAPKLTRAPQFAEHTDEILRELGWGDEELLELKVDGAVT